MKKLVLIVFFVFVSNVHSANLREFDIYEYWIPTGEFLTVEWQAVENAKYYQFKIIHEETGRVIKFDNSIALTKTFTMPKTGHYVCYVRACESETNCSDWAISVDPTFATVKDAKRAWRCYAYIASPGIITIK